MKIVLLIGFSIFFLSRVIVRQLQQREDKPFKKSSFHITVAETGRSATIIFQLFVYPLKWNLLIGWQWLGIIIFILGVTISVYARIVLGDNWRTARKADKPRELVTTGIYGYTRHPIYFGSWLMGLGFELALASWIFFVILLIGSPFVLFCINEEEKLLLKWFGKEYRDYKNKTKRFMPHLF
ncbi:isoprenylcysteine carboxylmethyltransferase family protein [Patescibacteria group bacterium]|nr:isoprenylcysteine carboxylmethyltransferase family protein [Patescibacteria group bacterium]